ncbi:hypothetical protein IGI04_036879 [Brassica rapa subsp. trilocularis]|uniref:glutamine--tRNA ligase n=1 Tax=Brassica rapa subsp. trilocularis TaxID=1813537 RepID=A0ABQ7LIR8_BRACM|nr:hypothetical protein IGI04_036879 [Brassica rapa subsp. trilocularis]
MAPNADESVKLFLSIGLDEKPPPLPSTTPRSPLISPPFIHEAGVTDGCDRTTGNLLYTVATKHHSNLLLHRPTLFEYIVSSKIKTPAQLDAAVSFFDNHAAEDFKLNEFEEACGVGVEVSAKDIEKAAEKVFEENKSAIVEQRYRTNVGQLLGHVRKSLPWADPKIVKDVIDRQMYELLGERTAADNEKPTKKKEKKEKPAAKAEEKKAAVEATPEPSEEELNPYSIFPQPEQNLMVHTEVFYSDGSVLKCNNKKEVLDKHLKVTGGKVYTRFPPEPNGYLHIGHAKAMFVDFGLAKERGGCCYLRYDDTNPEAEKKEYINHIEEIVNWMGWEPFKITYTSDYFQELYDLAVELIRRGHAYVDHQFTPHPHAGDKWCIYPSYDFAHCTVDSLENITHSLCTLEFETRRASYYWLLHSLDLYMPYVWEYSRLNITNTVMSKRKLNYIVTNNHVDGWDDPRLLTLAGLRRRGVTPTAINAFVRGMGITRSDGSMIHVSRLEHHIREELNKTAPRTMVVLNPLKVVITNLESDKVMELDAKRWPDAQNDDPSAFYKVPFSRVVYIDQSDFRMKDSKDYYGLAPGKSVLLRYGFPIKCTNVFADDNETIREIHAEYDPEKKTKPKGVLHWVAESSPGKEPIKVEVRLFEKLFNSENPAELNDDWLTDINPNSKVVVSDAYAVSILKDAAVGDKFQFERLGYFAVDKDSEPGKLVFNRTVTLRDSYGKGGK